jgi:DNA-binding protein HU-beta
MNKRELIAAVAAHVGSDQAQARRHVEAVFETIMNSVMEGERVVVTGFGAFDRVTRSARTVRNPRTGRPIQVQSSLAPRFSVGRTFKEHVSGAPTQAAATSAPVKRAAAAAATAQVSASVSTEPTPDGKKKQKRKDARATNGGKKTKTAKSGKSSKSAKKAARKGK